MEAKIKPYNDPEWDGAVSWKIVGNDGETIEDGFDSSADAEDCAVSKGYIIIINS